MHRACKRSLKNFMNQTLRKEIEITENWESFNEELSEYYDKQGKLPQALVRAVDISKGGRFAYIANRRFRIP